jgi:hypothetical protein
MKKHLPGAQTERRGDAGPVGGLLGGKDLTGRFVSVSSPWSGVRSQETDVFQLEQRTIHSGPFVTNLLPAIRLPEG